MIDARPSPAVLQSRFLAIQVLGFAALTGFVFMVFSSGKGVLFLGAVAAAAGTTLLFIKPHLGVLIILTAWFVEIPNIAKLVSAVLMVPLGVAILRDRNLWVLRVPQLNILLLIGLLFLISTLWNDLKYPITLIPQLDQTRMDLQSFVTHMIFLIFFVYFVTTRQR
ncbi:MAG: hypothetical protein K0Q83_2693, partial [Deltaproteobacteria bacterium]|nr:hypothetical protein [Deltaproteobacteria bacterium]